MIKHLISIILASIVTLMSGCASPYHQSFGQAVAPDGMSFGITMPTDGENRGNISQIKLDFRWDFK